MRPFIVTSKNKALIVIHRGKKDAKAKAAELLDVPVKKLEAVELVHAATRCAEPAAIRVYADDASKLAAIG